ncbi:MULTISPECIES: thiol:disulfide interchange protein DsbA/DsbL [Candidatus Ichthyocystis]|uniref:thiol:disulfide interchange protein DsbA/DsbL n=1 Tax=Candidatus Ichthyocystis TaxID=2929841 RepID=UPI001585838F|nr:MULTISPECIES: thiol:disulfide interchange protein DsbA/DsbL [Ichthyocystis]
MMLLKFTKRLSRFLATSVLLAVPLLSKANVYTLVPHPSQTDRGVVTVQEFFWYSCPHCYQLEPKLDEWIHRLPKNVKMEIIPAVTNTYWRRMAILYYSLQELGQMSRLHKKIFEAQHISHTNLYDADVLKQFLEENGVSWDKYQKAANSFGVITKVSRSEALVKNYNISGVPSFVVDGRYLVSIETAGSESELFKALDETIKMARKNSEKIAKAK